MNFRGWRKVEEYNTTCETPIYCKAQLSKMGLKPKTDAIPERHRVSHDGSWREFEFYTLDQCVEKRKVTRVVNDLAVTPENLCAALYVINKSAKVSRDTAQTSYADGNHTQAHRSKSRKDELYQLKDIVMRKLIDTGVLEFVGYHVQITERQEHKTRCSSCKYNGKLTDECVYCVKDRDFISTETVTQTSYLLLYRYNTYRFHVPCERKPDGAACIGEIKELISSTATREREIKYTDAVRLLQKYCNEVIAA